MSAFSEWWIKAGYSCCDEGDEEGCASNAWNAAIEAAAKVCVTAVIHGDIIPAEEAATDCAAAIRAMKEE